MKVHELIQDDLIDIAKSSGFKVTEIFKKSCLKEVILSKSESGVEHKYTINPQTQSWAYDFTENASLTRRKEGESFSTLLKHLKLHRK